MMSLTIERVSIGNVQPDPANVRKHNERNLQAIKTSLEKFGQQKPIVIDSDGIVRAGNGTLLAARDLGWEEIDIVRSDLPLNELRAYAVADNKTSDLSEFDFEQLAGLFKDLQADDATLLEMTGFADFEIEPLLAAEWKPAQIEPLPDGSNKMHTIQFTGEQWSTVHDAINHRNVSLDQPLNAADTITEICHEAMQ